MDIRTSEISQNHFEISRNSHRLNMTYIVDTHADKTAYKKDKTCVVCSANFGIIGLTQKHHCNFCYRGVCWKCSLQQAEHPETHEIVRICENCHNKSIQSKVTKEFEGSLVDIKSEIKILKEKLQNEVRATRSEKLIKTGIKSNLQETIETNKEIEKELYQKMTDFKLSNLEIENENGKIADNINQLVRNEDEVTEELAMIQAKIDEGMNELRNYQIKINEIKDMTCKQILENDKQTKMAKKAEKIKAKTDISRKHKENEEKDQRLRIEKTKQEIEEVKRMNTRLIHKIKGLQEHEETEEVIRNSLDDPYIIPERSSFNPRQGDPYKLLRDRQKAQIEEISKIQFEIKNVRTMNSILETRKSRDPIQRDECKCLIQ